MEPLQSEKRTELRRKSLESQEKPSHCDPQFSPHKKTRDSPREEAARAREEAIKKAVVARKVLSWKIMLSLVASRQESSLKMDNVKVLDGSSLTFELHSHVNSSLGISKSCCLLNTSCMDNLKRWDSSVDSSFKTSDSWKVSACDKHKDSHKSLCEPSISVDSLDSDPSKELNRPSMGKIGMKPYSLRTMSNASFHSFQSPFQASACESGFFREPS